MGTKNKKANDLRPGNTVVTNRSIKSVLITDDSIRVIYTDGQYEIFAPDSGVVVEEP